MNLKSAYFCQGRGPNDHHYVGLDHDLRRLVGHYATTMDAKRAVRAVVLAYQHALGLTDYAEVFMVWESRGRRYSGRV